MDNNKRAKSRIRRKNGGIRKIILFAILLFIIITVFIKVIIPGVTTFSRYVYSAVRSFYLNSKEFYFNSDKLSANVATFESSNWSGVGEYEVPINMNSRKNLNEHAKTNIEYEIEYEYKAYKSTGEAYDDSIVDFYLKDSGRQNIDLTTTPIRRQILMSSNYVDTFYFAVKTTVPLNNRDYILVKITATSTKPYTSTLKGEFKLIIGNQDVNYKIEDKEYDPYAELIITNEFNSYTSKVDGTVLSIDEYLALPESDKANYYSKKIELSFDPSIVVLDTTSSIYIDAITNSETDDIAYTTITKVEDSTDEFGNPIQVTTNYDYISYISFYIEAEESKVIKFYKVDASQNYTYDSVEDTLVVNVSYT